MATASVTPAPAQPKLTFSQRFKADAAGLFKWLGAPKNQQVIVTGEAVGETVANLINPGLAGIDPLISNWTQEVFKADELAVAAASSDESTNAEKATMVLTNMVPQVVLFCQQNGLPVPVGSNIDLANASLVTFLKAISGGSTPVTPSVPAIPAAPAATA